MSVAGRPGQHRIDPYGSAAVVAAVLCWTSMPLFIKWFTDFFDQYTQNGLRCTVAALLWLPVLLWAAQTGRLNARIWRDALIPSALGVGGQTFWAWSMYYLDPGLVSFVVQLSVVWAAIFAMIIFPDERALLRSAEFWTATALGAIGFFLLVLGGPQRHLNGTWVGIALVSLCAILWAAHTTSVRCRLSGHPALFGYAVVALYSAVGLDALMFGFGDVSDVGRAGTKVLLVLALSGVVGLGIANVFWYSGIKRLGVTISNGMLLAWPFLTAMLSVAIFKERLTLLQWIGGAGLVSGAALLLLAQRAVLLARVRGADGRGRRTAVR